MSSQTTLSFLGAAQTVTGSKYLLKTADKQVLVDAGLFQGIKTRVASAELQPKRVFVTHGEPSAADAFRRRLAERFAWQVEVPEQGSVFALH